MQDFCTQNHGQYQDFCISCSSNHVILDHYTDVFAYGCTMLGEVNIEGSKHVTSLHDQRQYNKI